MIAFDRECQSFPNRKIDVDPIAPEESVQYWNLLFSPPPAAKYTIAPEESVQYWNLHFSPPPAAKHAFHRPSDQ